jgi:hypothetical protein
MKKLERKDIRGPHVYGPIRDDVRKYVVALKRHRRVAVGSLVTIVFENRQTMIFQIEEMLRAESITDEDKIEAEIAVYNTLLPDEGELSATIFVEIADSREVRPTLERLVGIDEQVFLEVDGMRAQARFEAGRSTEERISSVQYLRFPLDAQQRKRLCEGAPVRLLIEHPHYGQAVDLAELTRLELARDLS